MEYVDAEASGLSKARIQQIAEDISRKFDVLNVENIADIVESLGGVIEYSSMDEFSEAVDASLFVDGEADYRIVLPDFTPVTRDRFSVAHELGHYFLHYPIVKKPMKAHRRGSNRVEWEANWFAASLLMPELEFRETLQRFDNDVDIVALHFNVSTSAVETRIKDISEA